MRLNLAKDPVRKLVDVASKLSQLVTELSPILQKRYSDEQRGVQSPGKAVIRDIDFLRKLGLTAYVEEYEVEQRELAEAGAEDQADPALNHVEARSERDLAEEVEIPALTPRPPPSLGRSTRPSPTRRRGRPPDDPDRLPARVQGGTRGPPGPSPLTWRRPASPVGPDRQRRNAGRRCRRRTISAITALQSDQRPRRSISLGSRAARATSTLCSSVTICRLTSGSCGGKVFVPSASAAIP